MDKSIKVIKLLSEQGEPYSLDAQIAYVEYCVNELKNDKAASKSYAESQSYDDVMRMHNGILENLYAVRHLNNVVDKEAFYNLEKQHG